MAELFCEVVTPARVVFSGTATLVVVPGEVGELGFQPLHAPLAALLGVGEVRLTFADGGKEFIAISQGYVKVLEDKVTILTESAELSSEIDAKYAEKQLEDARSRLSQEDLSDVEVLKAEMELKRAQARLKVAERRQKN